MGAPEASDPMFAFLNFFLGRPRLRPSSRRLRSSRHGNRSPPLVPKLAEIRHRQFYPPRQDFVSMEPCEPFHAPLAFSCQFHLDRAAVTAAAAPRDEPNSSHLEVREPTPCCLACKRSASSPTVANSLRCGCPCQRTARTPTSTARRCRTSTRMAWK